MARQKDYWQSIPQPNRFYWWKYSWHGRFHYMKNIKDLK